MAIMIREYLGNEGIKVDWNTSITEAVNLKEFNGKADHISPDSLMVDIEGIHVGPTRNYTHYTEQALKGSIPSWTNPYQRPLIMHHNEKDGKIIGRIKHAVYTDTNTRSNTGALIFTANVPDTDGKEGIKNGTLKTTSIGVIVHDARCSICNHNIAEEGPCDHERGVRYDDKTCYWVIYSMEAKELSYVIVPSDVYAHNIQYYKPQEPDLKESSTKGVLNLSEANKTTEGALAAAEAQIVNEEGDKTATADAAPAVADAPAAADTSALEAEIVKLTAKNSELEANAKKLEEDLKVAEEAKAAAAKDLETVKVLLGQTTKSLEEVQVKLTAKESEISSAMMLREAAETEVLNFKKEMRESLIEKVEILRTSLGKPMVAREELSKRTEDSLKDALLDLKEEMANPTDFSKITKVKPEGIVENTVGTAGTNVKEAKSPSNIGLAEATEKLFTQLATGK